MNKKATKALKAKSPKPIPKTSLKKPAKYTRRKGGTGGAPGAPGILQAYNTISTQPSQQQPQQPSQQPQAGVLGTALNDLKNNKEMFQPVYDTASSFGLLYNFGVAIMTTIFASLFIYGGVLTKNYYNDYSICFLCDTFLIVHIVYCTFVT